MVLANRLSTIDKKTLEPCNHTEADTRIFLHLAHAANQGHEKAFVRTVDNDIVVLALSLFGNVRLTEVWIGFGSGKSYRDIPVHILHQQLGPSKSLALPLFHSLTRCDTTSHILSCGKKSGWNAWQNTPLLTETLIALTNDPECLTLKSVHIWSASNDLLF